MTRDELLRRLIAIDSRSEVSNRGIADFICDYVDAPGVRIVRNQSPDGTKLNVVATRGPARDDRSGLVLSGHMDTVPFGEPDWATDPLVLDRRDDRYVGRGVCDMKGFLALAVERFAEAPAASRASAGPALHVRRGAGHDRGPAPGGDAGPALEPLPRAAVIGEPTSLEVVRMHKGHFKLRIVMLGRPGSQRVSRLGQERDRNGR